MVPTLRLFGPVGASLAGRELAVGPRQQRAVLALLALNIPRPVRVQTFIDSIWPDGPPETVLKSVHKYIAALRSELGASTILRQAEGYRLMLGRDDIDLLAASHRVRKLLGPNDLDPARRLHLLTAAVANRPQVLADLDFEFADLERVSWRLLQSEANVARYGDAVAVGRYDVVIDEVHPLVGRSVGPERRWCLLAVALHRVGRGAEAVAVCQQVVGNLRAQGFRSPVPALVALQQLILDDDPRLDAITLDDRLLGR